MQTRARDGSRWVSGHWYGELRDHTGRVNQGAFKALEDYLSSLAIL